MRDGAILKVSYRMVSLSVELPDLEEEFPDITLNVQSFEVVETLLFWWCTRK